MALAPHPDILRCANKWRHGEATLPAVAFVGEADVAAGLWTPRCQGCVNSLAAANPAGVRAHIVYIAPDQPVADHDPQPTGERANH
jgi:hypothetical protein